MTKSSTSTKAASAKLPASRARSATKPAAKKAAAPKAPAATTDRTFHATALLAAQAAKKAKAAS